MSGPRRTATQAKSVRQGLKPTMKDTNDVLKGEPAEVWTQYLVAVHTNLEGLRGDQWAKWLTARKTLLKAFQKLYPGQDPHRVHGSAEAWRKLNIHLCNAAGRRGKKEFTPAMLHPGLSKEAVALITVGITGANAGNHTLADVLKVEPEDLKLAAKRLLQKHPTLAKDLAPTAEDVSHKAFAWVLNDLAQIHSTAEFTATTFKRLEFELKAKIVHFVKVLEHYPNHPTVITQTKRCRMTPDELRAACNAYFDADKDLDREYWRTDIQIQLHRALNRICRRTETLEFTGATFTALQREDVSTANLILSFLRMLSRGTDAEITELFDTQIGIPADELRAEAVRFLTQHEAIDTAVREFLITDAKEADESSSQSKSVSKPDDRGAEWRELYRQLNLLAGIQSTAVFNDETFAQRSNPAPVIDFLWQLQNATEQPDAITNFTWRFIEQMPNYKELLNEFWSDNANHVLLLQVRNHKPTPRAKPKDEASKPPAPTVAPRPTTEPELKWTVDFHPELENWIDANQHRRYMDTVAADIRGDGPSRATGLQQAGTAWQVEGGGLGTYRIVGTVTDYERRIFVFHGLYSHKTNGGKHFEGIGAAVPGYG